MDKALPRDSGRLRIALLARACYPLHGRGGLERHVYDLVRHLLARDTAIALITPPDRTRRPSQDTGDWRHAIGDGAEAWRPFEDPRCVRFVVPYRTFPFAGRRGTTVIDRSTAYPLFGRRAGRLAARLVARHEVDLVYGLGASALGYARARARGATAPFVFNPQGLEEFGATDPRYAGASLKRIAYAPLRRAVRTCALAADCVVATDHVLVPVVRQHLDVAPERLRVIPNGIDLDSCDRLAGPGEGRQMRERHGIGERDFVLLSVGRLEANKGFEVLARALAHLGNATASWLWVLVGDGPRRSSIERAVASLGLRDRVRLAGRIGDADLHAWYEAANLFVHPTLYEGSSLVTLEAMAHRRAVLATRAGGLPDKVRPGISGWLVEPGDAAGLAAALGDALAHADRLRAMGSEGRALAERDFSWPRVADAFLQLCAELVRARPPVPA